MPVIANQKKPDHLYCPPDALHPASLHHGLPYHPAQLNGNTLRRTLEEFRAHHQACAARRRNGLEYELRVEAQRTEWLTRKFMDGVRQQQQQQSGSGTATTGSGGAAQGKTEQRSGSEGTTSAAANAASASGTASSATEVSGDITVGQSWYIVGELMTCNCIDDAFMDISLLNSSAFDYVVSGLICYMPFD